MKELTIFENSDFGKVRFVELNGKAYAVAKDVAVALGYKNTNAAISTHCKGVVKSEGITIKGSQIALIPQPDIIRFIIRCKLESAEKFESWIFDEVIPGVLNEGRFDGVENKLKAINGPVERQLSLELHGLENLIKMNTTDTTISILYNQKQLQLNTYKQEIKLKEQDEKLKLLDEKVVEFDNKIKATMVLREGDLSPEAIAKKFNIFSMANKPHGLFAERVAKALGIYLNPQGNIGYQDENISVNLSTRGGQTVPTVKYSKTEYEEMKKYIEGGNLTIESPAKYYVRGSKKGKFNHGTMIFDDGNIKINEITYNLYTDNF